MSPFLVIICPRYLLLLATIAAVVIWHARVSSILIFKVMLVVSVVAIIHLVELLSLLEVAILIIVIVQLGHVCAVIFVLEVL